jgi:hypothetical protein
LDENASASIAVKHKARSKNVILSTNHVGAYIAKVASILINMCNAKNMQAEATLKLNMRLSI